MKTLKRLLLTAAVATAPLCARAYDSAQADSNGNVTFTPQGLLTPIITGAIAAVAAGAAMVVLGVGVRWIYRAIKAR
jgi:hypothetical protein